MTQTMQAITIEGGKGPAEALKPVTMPGPEPKPNEVLIAVRAAGVNRPDVVQRLGSYPPPPGAPETLGLEVAGVVEAVGQDVARWKVGDRVCALLGGGGYAEYAVADAGSVLPIPGDLSFEQAAALPETVFTVWANVFEGGSLKSGETFLVHGATSGIGTTALQMAKAAGARVVATSRGADKAAKALELGADVAIDTSVEDFAEVEGGVDVILDMVGGPFLKGHVKALKPLGRLVQIATVGGRSGELDLAMVMMKRLTLTGSTLRSRPVAEKARIAAAVEATVWPWVAGGLIRPMVDRTFPLAEASKAHALMESGDFVGKIVLVP